jgi:hypothetical protein
MRGESVQIHKDPHPRLVRPRGRAEPVEPARTIPAHEGHVVVGGGDDQGAPVVGAIEAARPVQGFRIPTTTDEEPSIPADEPAAPLATTATGESPVASFDLAGSMPAAEGLDARSWACPECGNVATLASTCASCGFTPTDERDFLPVRSATPLAFVFGGGVIGAARAAAFLMSLVGVALIGFL